MQLEVNINSYGKALEDDYEKDSHIWREIEELKRIDKKKEFNVHKELLIYYLSLMLKEDWERSKQEVKGYSRTFIEVILIPIINCIMGTYYSYKLDNGFDGIVEILANTIIISVIIICIFKNLLDMLIWRNANHNRIRKTYLRKIVISYICFALITGITSMVLFGLLQFTNPNLLLQNLMIWVIGVGEFIFIYFNWIDIICKKVQLARSVIYARQKILGERQLEQYNNDIKEMYDYVINTDLDSKDIKSAYKLFKSLKVEYKFELNDRKRMLKKERTDLKKLKEYNQIEDKIKELDEISDKIKNFTKKAQIYKQKT